MTIKIKLSQLGDLTPEGFAKRITAFVVATKEYAAHLEGVKADENDETIAKPFKRVAFPGPTEDPLIAQAAHEGYEFEGPSLEEKKAALFAEVRRLENEALQAIMPSAKARHWQFREMDINAERDAAFEASRLTGTLKFPIGDDNDIFMKDMEARRVQCARVSRVAAKHEHDIHGLTEETVDRYVIGGAFS